MFSFSAAVSVLLLFFTKNIYKTALLFFNAFLSSSFICFIFRQPGPAACILIAGALFSAIFIYLSNRLDSETVHAKGITPKFFKIFSGLCCLSLFFSILLSADELKDKVPVLQETAAEEKKGIQDSQGIYSAVLSVLSLSIVFPGSRLIVYRKEKEDA